MKQSDKFYHDMTAKVEAYNKAYREIANQVDSDGYESLTEAESIIWMSRLRLYTHPNNERT